MSVPPVHVLPPEILYLVFESLDAESLTSVALTCRSWSETGAYVKWTTCVVPLVWLLRILVPTRSICDMFEVLLWFKTHSSINGIADDRKNRFLNRASIITKLSVRNPIEERSLEMLRQLLGDEAGLCPNLTHLTVLYSTDITPTCALFASPQPRSVEIYQGCHNGNVSFVPLPPPWVGRTVLQALDTAKPKITRLITSFATRHEYVFAQTPHVRKIVYGGAFSFDFWNRISADCPSLESFSCGDQSWDEPSPCGLSPPTPTFHSLRYLNLSFQVRENTLLLGFVGLLLFVSNMPVLEVLKMPFLFPSNPLVWTVDAFHPIIQRSPLIHDITLRYFKALNPSFMKPIVLPFGWERLKSFTVLVHANHPQDCDVALKLIPDSLHNLESLGVLFERARSTSVELPMGLSLDALLQALIRHPELQRIRATVNAIQGTLTAETRSYPGIVYLQLDPLYVDLATNDLQATIDVLGMVFPNLTEVEATVTSSDGQPYFFSGSGIPRGPAAARISRAFSRG